MARKKKEKGYDPNLPKPKLEWRDGQPFVTDGWIMGSRVIIKQQPSIETIKYVNKLFADKARKMQNGQAV
ncbi:hypothetical protein [Clostridium tertium]|uniref:hypothetical protein n=1 Tax=Clostridium tertium TaxID=1559 RepID=UPI00356B05AC